MCNVGMPVVFLSPLFEYFLALLSIHVTSVIVFYACLLLVYVKMLVISSGVARVASASKFI